MCGIRHERMGFVGSQGWIRVDKFCIPSLENKGVWEVFDGLNMVD